MNAAWVRFKVIVEQLTGIPSHILDYMAVLDVLKLIASGLGADSISSILDISIETIQEISNEFFYVDCRDEDLLANPLKIYMSRTQLYTFFSAELERVVPSITRDEKNTFFKACLLYTTIKTEVENNYE